MLEILHVLLYEINKIKAENMKTLENAKQRFKCNTHFIKRSSHPNRKRVQKPT